MTSTVSLIWGHEIDDGTVYFVPVGSEYIRYAFGRSRSGMITSISIASRDELSMALQQDDKVGKAIPVDLVKYDTRLRTAYEKIAMADARHAAGNPELNHDEMDAAMTIKKLMDEITSFARV